MKKINPILLAMTLTCGNISLVHAQTVDQLHFGPQQETSGNRIDGVAAIVGNDVITMREFNALGGNRGDLERLIIRKLLLQTAKEHNVSIGDTALNIELDRLQKEGKTVSREQLREELMIQKLQQQVAASLVNITDAEVASIVDKQMKQVDSSMQLVDILIRVPEGADVQTLKAAEEKTQRLLAALKVRDGRSVANEFGAIYNELGWVELAKIPTTFSKVLLDAPVGEYLKPVLDRDGVHILKIVAEKSGKPIEGVRIPEAQVSHILIKNGPEAKRLIDDLYLQLKGGAQFASLAMQYSQDELSAVQGGALGWVREGQMVPSFEAVMNTTAVGDISKPFQSKFGYHILTVKERRQINPKGREALKQQARKQLFHKKASEEWDLWLSRLRDEAYVEILAK